MENVNNSMQSLIESAGWLAPVLFILIHLLRPFLFLPVIVVCIAGGVFFGFVEGAILSFIGLSLMSLVFYRIVNVFPKFRQGIGRLKEKVFHDRTVSVSQVMVLRIMPFIHFHLLSLYLMEMTKTFKGYMYYSLLGVIMPAVLYTAFGEAISKSPWYLSIIFSIILILLYALLGKIHNQRMESKKG
ncbi:TVP38/TMEM64 family protein [Sediminibacillus massiliensis]|uniref:TVP38/TMEM64 family protein n=1 Tax=Sediminibacillus massiliensis TaxID=1926277 RepID=UPI0009888EC8|nr:VTT domain-containing protein [Sediminibacillus massiliensis]